MLPQLLLFLFFLLVVYWIFLLIVGIINFILGIPSLIYNSILDHQTEFLILLGLGILIVLFIWKLEKDPKLAVQKEKDEHAKELMEKRERQMEYDRRRRIREEEEKEKRRVKAEETRRKNAEKKRKEEVARKEKERKEKAARKERERKEAIAREKAEQVELVVAQCRKDGMPSELTTSLSRILSNVTNPSHRDVLVNIWQPLGKPIGGSLEAYQSWMLTQVSGLTSMRSIKSELNKLNKQVVTPMNKDLSHLVSTAPSSSRYDRLVYLWKKYQDMQHSDEVIERIYKGENEDFVLASLDILQS